MKIAVDAMGGDYAPGVVVEGTATALCDFPDCEIVLVGHEAKLRFYIEKYGLTGHPRLRVVHAPEVVEMRELSSTSLRTKKHSSITECARLLKSGEVDGMVTPGHTGATVAATKVLVRTLPGVDRPALAASMPAERGRFIMVDAGANTDCSPLHLLQFALMGEVYARYLYRLSEPRIGLLSVGGEDVKGNALTKQVFPLMNEKFSNFVGNVEADTIFEGIADVLVADGYTGNVFLKGCEGLARSTIYWLKEVLLKNPWRKTTASMLGNAFRELKSKGSAEDIGGAPLLGINGICIIGHGSSTSRAVRNAIRVCAECIEFDLNGRILQRLKETGCLASDLTEEFRKRPQK
ncbi:MAG: phosphate acyltransferase PlsX [Lentisphaeria bacterium]|nr:phosphate acyltransferase PlsX [Lentisphaeria bacterium]